MLSAPMLDPLGALITEARADPHVSALVSTRVRGYEPAGRTDTYPGDVRDPGDYVAFVVISALSVPPHLSLPITFADYAINAYGTDAPNAWAVYGALVKAFHKVGERVKGNGLGIYQSLVVTGGEQDRDPGNQQPVVRGTVRIVATAQAVA